MVGVSPRSKILLVEDTPALARTYCGYLKREPLDVIHVETGKAALAAVRDESPEAVLLDLRLPDIDGFEVLEELLARAFDGPIVVITAHGSVNTAVEAMRAGASDFLVKPFSAERLKVTLNNLLENRQLAEIVKTYESEADRHEFEGFIGSSLIMQSVYRAIESAAASDATVFVTGESGTGKEICATAIHRRSRRRNGPFVPINCAAIPAELIESEIFGHVKGAFTGAVSDRKGAAELANGGTLFLDEICEMDTLLQSKLLRFVQTGTFTKIGSGSPMTVDIRFVCATNREPLAEVHAGRFREDLYYRLHVIPIELPPLRQRGQDIVEIARHFLTHYAKREGKNFKDLDPGSRDALQRYGWPGNVRELQNVIQKMVVMDDGEVVREDMLPVLSQNSSEWEPPSSSSVGEMFPTPAREGNEREKTTDLEILAKKIRPLDIVERDAIEQALRLCNDDVRKAAVFLGVAPATIYRKLKNWQGETC